MREAGAKCAAFVLISFSLWHTRFHSDPRRPLLFMFFLLVVFVGPRVQALILDSKSSLSTQIQKNPTDLALARTSSLSFCICVCVLIQIQIQTADRESSTNKCRMNSRRRSSRGLRRGPLTIFRKRKSGKRLNYEIS